MILGIDEVQGGILLENACTGSGSSAYIAGRLATTTAQ